jgi:hypothetical protein
LTSPVFIITVILVVIFLISGRITSLSKIVGFTYTVSRNANVRESPTTNAKIVKTLTTGDIVKGYLIDDDANGTWVEFEENDQKNYISLSVVDVSSVQKFLSVSNRVFTVGYNFVKNGFVWIISTSWAKTILYLLILMFVIQIFADFCYEKQIAVVSALDKICPRCGIFGSMDESRQLMGSENQQQTYVETHTQKNYSKSGQLIGTSEVPIERTKNITINTYKVTRICSNCKGMFVSTITSSY